MFLEGLSNNIIHVIKCTYKNVCTTVCATLVNLTSELYFIIYSQQYCVRICAKSLDVQPCKESHPICLSLTAGHVKLKISPQVLVSGQCTFDLYIPEIAVNRSDPFMDLCICILFLFICAIQMYSSPIYKLIITRLAGDQK